MQISDLITMTGWVAAGTGFTFAMTTVGAASVFFFRKTISEKVHRLALGLAAGIMIAASVWSLLIPAMEAARRISDELETFADKSSWPVPTYSEILFYV